MSLAIDSSVCAVTKGSVNLIGDTLETPEISNTPESPIFAVPDKVATRAFSAAGSDHHPAFVPSEPIPGTDAILDSTERPEIFAKL